MVFLTKLIARLVDDTFILTWDVLSELTNLVLPNRKEGHVAPEGHPDFGGKWLEYTLPKDGDSRCVCQSRYTFSKWTKRFFQGVTERARAAFNMSHFFCYYVRRTLLDRSYGKDACDLEEMTNGAQTLATDLKGIRANLIFLSSMGHGILQRSSPRQLSGGLPNHDRAINISGDTTLLTIFGRRPQDIEALLAEERIPEGWEAKVSEPLGLTLTGYGVTVIPLEIQTNEKEAAKGLTAKMQNQAE
ncbi:hypothetical protein AX15_000304 [Amanita polypyramis BW_CC]|nr:hypothetical protein AX15_000304 [Amanita polypyramis BW_CC]